MNGVYRGRVNKIGFDGIWQSPSGQTIVVEVKTSDTYRINLDTLLHYRNKLVDESQVGAGSPVLLVVGREDTGDLEAQIRGSRHAWDARLISAVALTKLMRLKEAGDDETANMIRNLLVPREYTRLDDLINVLFRTVEDIRTPVEEGHEEDASDVTGAESSVDSSSVISRPYESDRHALEGVRDGILRAFGNQLDKKFIKRSKATYWTSDRKHRVCCTISKLYGRQKHYWYAYHPKWAEFLSGAEEGYLLLGCLGLEWAFAIPQTVIHDCLDNLSSTTRENGQMYWHLHLIKSRDGKFGLRLTGKGKTLPVDEYKVSIAEDGSYSAP